MSVYLNLQSVLDKLTLDKTNSTAPDSRAYLKKVEFPKISATSIEIFKEYSKQEFSFPIFAGKLHAARRECKQNLQDHERRFVKLGATTAAVAAVASYIDLVAVEILGIFNWPTAIFLSVPATLWGVHKLTELQQPKEPVRHKTFDTAIKALGDYRTYFTGDNFDTLKAKITTKLQNCTDVERRLYTLALDQLLEANSFSK